MSRQKDIQKLINNHTRRRQKLLEKKAELGYSADPSVETEIEDIETELTRLQAKLEALQAAETPPLDPRLLRGHFFISYAPTDGADFAAALSRALNEAGTPTWFDGHLAPDSPPQQQIKTALETCAGLLLILTPNSNEKFAGCAAEWGQALSYKKPIALLRLNRETDAPYRLRDHPNFDFSGAASAGSGSAFDAALRRLRQHLANLDAPAGQVQQLKARLATAHADLRLARDPQRRARVQKDIDEWKQELKILKKIAADPAAAIEETRRSIAAGIERARQPAARPARLKRSKFINPPPMNVPGYFQDRFDETKRLGEFLKDPALRLLIVIGRGGIGKTALVARLLEHLQRGELPDGIGRLPVDGIVYLSDAGARPLTFPNLFSDLSQLLPAETAQTLNALYRNPHTSTRDKMAALLSSFALRPSSLGKAEGDDGPRPVIVLLDNFETRLTPDHALNDAELDEGLRALLRLPPHRVKAIITTRVPPKDLMQEQPQYQVPLFLERGLDSPYAENLLRKRDPDGVLGLKNAPDALLRRAKTRVRGYPRALEALSAALVADRDADLEDLLAAAQTALPDKVVEVMAGEAFNRLPPAAREVMSALAIYNRPVSAVAVDYLLEPVRPAANSAPILKRLFNMNFASKESGQYYLHPIDRAYALSRIANSERRVTNDERRATSGKTRNLKPETRNWYARAADYYKTTRKPRAEWRSLNDLAPQLAEFDLRCQAGDFDAAARVLTEIDFDYLLPWGHYRLMIDLHTQLQGKIEDATLQQLSIGRLGEAYRHIGQAQQAIIYYRQALESARTSKNKWSEGAWLGKLGLAYRDIGKTHRAIKYYQDALRIARATGDRRREGKHLVNMGNAYSALGETRRAIEYYERALTISRIIGNRWGEGSDLGSLGGAYSVLGETRRAIKYYKDALRIARAIGDRRGEGVRLDNLGLAYSNLGETRRAIEYYKKAIANAVEIGNGKGEATRWGNLGQALLDQNHLKEAAQSFQTAIQIADKLNFPQAKNYAYSGLAQAHLYANNLPAARAAIEAAWRYDVPQNNHNAAALRGVIALQQGEATVAAQAFSQTLALADDLLAKTPQLYEALYAKGLALCGLALGEMRGAESGRESESLPPPNPPPAGGRAFASPPAATEGRIEGGRNPHPLPDSAQPSYLTQALEAYRAALKLNADAGALARQRRLLQALAAVDSAGGMDEALALLGG